MNSHRPVYRSLLGNHRVAEHGAKKTFRRRPLALMAGAICIAATFIVAPAAPVALGQAATDADFFVDRFGDALDYSNPEDVPISTTLTTRASAASLDGGRLRIALTEPGWISLLWAGVPGGIPHGREGVVNPIDASRYGRLGVGLRVGVAQPVIALWHTCAAANASCQGGTLFSASPDQLSYAINLAPVTSDPGLSAPWSGSIVGLRLLFPAGSGSVELDWARLAPLGDQPLSERTDRVGAPTPNESLDYATWAGNRWDFDDADATTAGVGSSSISGGALRACNAPTKASTGDPSFTLRLPSGSIDADRFHRLVVALRQDGPFSLAFGPGGGMNMRVVWRDAANRRHVSKDIVMYNNESTVSFDLRDTRIGPLGIDATPWGGRITEFRIDPNEDAAARCWTVDHVWLLADDGVDLGPRPAVTSSPTVPTAKKPVASAKKPVATTKRPATPRKTTRKKR